MRLTCGSHVVGCVWWHLQLLFAARGLPKTSSEPRRGRGIVFRNSRISLSAGRRACEPAAKPAIPGVILLHNGFVWPERAHPRFNFQQHHWRLACACEQGTSPQFPGVLVGPPPTFASAIKCHQKSTSNSAGSSVGSLAPPRATPRLGGVYVSCQYFPCSFVLALRELGLRLGVKAQLPLRASSRGVLPGAGALEYGNRQLRAGLRIKTAVSNSTLETIVVPRSPAQSRQSLPRRQRSHGR